MNYSTFFQENPFILGSFLTKVQLLKKQKCFSKYMFYNNFISDLLEAFGGEDELCIYFRKPYMKRQTSFRKCQHYYLENMAGFKRGYDGKIAGLYDLDKTLGRGHFAVVKLARHVFTGEKVAVKVIDKTKLDTLSTGHLFQEVRCMKLVQHPNIVRLYEVIDTQTKLYLILELGDGGDMFDYIMKHEEGLNEDLAKKYFAQIVHAISYCHKLHVVHRDLKPENVVFFEKPGLVKLTDFGFSNKFQPGKKLTTSCGSLAYSAPEILLGDEYDAPAVGKSMDY